jgi:hypothetical protein
MFLGDVIVFQLFLCNKEIQFLNIGFLISPNMMFLAPTN